MLIGCLELEIGLEVHLGSLFELVSGDEAVHMQTFTVRLVAFLSTDAHFRLLLEVLEFEFFFLHKCAIIECARKLALSRVGLLPHILADQVWVLLLT